MTVEFIRNRITQLRMLKGVSEYRMSYDLGHSRGYVNNISSGKSLPSMMEFLAICEYFDISPEEFFNEKNTDPKLSNKILQQTASLDQEDLDLISTIMDRFLNKRK